MELIEKFLLPIATGTAFGFIINWLLEIIREKRKRANSLRSLQIILESIPRYNLYNQTATDPSDPPKHIVPMSYPIEPFENAILSQNSIQVKTLTIQATIDYLIKANELNSLIHSLQSSRFVSENDETIRLTRQFIFDQSKNDMQAIAEMLKIRVIREQNIVVRFSQYLRTRKK